MTAAVYASRTIPAATYEKNKIQCWRCGIIRDARAKTNLCMDCRPYANDFERES